MTPPLICLYFILCFCAGAGATFLTRRVENIAHHGYPTDEEFLRDLSVMWEVYALCPDEKLTVEARDLKRKMLEIVGGKA